ncbi:MULTISPECIES: hypothetical protein [unclassified Actinotalea]|uniref:hypothetical protein n=1 Tax=unclassified Actinotalea TaxID=2638618 RepID=UPI0015F40F2C|nr:MULTISPECIES: hypothetical protein [unclassified Actinotalea]
MGVELSWSTAVVRAGQDPSGPAALARDGLDWDRLAPGEPLTTVRLLGVATALLDHPGHPKHLVAEVVASWPTTPPGHAPLRDGLTVALHMHRWAMYGGGEDLVRVAGFLTPWLLGAVDALRADTAYATLDRVQAEDGWSPWEWVVAAPTERDLRSRLWGHGWGTLLGPAHLEAVGGAAALAGVPGAQVVPRPGGFVWVTLGDDPGAAGRADVAALREVLLPALATGERTHEEFVREALADGFTEHPVV